METPDDLWHRFYREVMKGEKDMYPDEENSADLSWLISLIGDALKEAQGQAAKIARGPGGREVALCITKLEEAKHRAVDAMMIVQPPEPPINEQSGQPTQIL